MSLRAGSDVYALGSANINLRNLNAFNQAATGYDLYKLNRVKIYIQPMYPTAATTDPAQYPLNTAPNTTFWCYVDPAFEGVAGTTQQTVINATNVQFKTLSINNLKLVANYKPRITQSITAEPVVNSMVRGANTWVNTQTDIIRWNAIKFYSVLTGGASQFSNTALIAPRLRVIVEYDVNFKIPRANITLPTTLLPRATTEELSALVIELKEEEDDDVPVLESRSLFDQFNAPPNEISERSVETQQVDEYMQLMNEMGRNAKNTPLCRDNDRLFDSH